MNTTWSRREFLELSGAAVGASLATPSLRAGRVPPSDTVRFGMVGVGMQGSGLLGESIKLPGGVCAGAADLDDGSLGRNDPTGAWEYPPPPDLSPRTLDWEMWQGDVPKRAFDPNIFARWRCWKEYGTGVAGVLLVHLISGLLFMLSINEPPRQALAVGGISRWKDGRNMATVRLTNFYYGDLPVSMRLNLGTELPETYRFHGAKGMLELAGSQLTVSPQSGRDTEPSYYTTSYPSALRQDYEEQWHWPTDRNMGERLPFAETTTFTAPHFDGTRVHLWNFFEAVRTRKPVVEDVVFGHHAALACHMANESYFRRSAVTWDEASKTIK